MTGEHHTQDARLKDIRTIRYVSGPTSPPKKGNGRVAGFALSWGGMTY